MRPPKRPIHAVSTWVQRQPPKVASESIKIYNAISDGTFNLVDKFFEMQRHDALKALDIYQRAGQQVIFSGMPLLITLQTIFCGENFIKIEQVWNFSLGTFSNRL
ncbi:hypothetical protein F0562_007520 [Nyssa sinensis]|uniref:AP180 N-terminal homology (ANTH) domain-containing protein n=1 Tax=Nyssa sinensis TaxID=561372 RepID=A0A5J5A3I9_9ASTE|nr:hypothetical protein F0562_007520 [Nyssa sinensis]